MRTLHHAVAAVLLATLLARVYADEHAHRYVDGEQVIVWANTVGPYQNTQELYEYFSLPFCRGTKNTEHKHETLGEALLGMNLVNTGIDIRYLKNQTAAVVCSTVLTDEQIKSFRTAIQQSYWYQHYIDGLPTWGWIGSSESASQQAPDSTSSDQPLYLNSHRNIIITYNKDRIIHISTIDAERTLLPAHTPAKGLPVSFVISVGFVPTTDSFENRFDKYLDSAFFEHKIRWFSIANSFMIVVFVVGLVVVILLRAVRRDFVRYDKEDPSDLERNLGDEYGWKQVHSDVFRPPPQLALFSALLGTGAQLVFLAFIVVLSTIIGDLYTNQSHILTAAIFTYSVGSVISGYVSASYYAQYGGRNWVRTMVYTVLLLPGLAGSSAFTINFVAIAYQSSRSLPITSVLSLLAIFVFLVLPLALLGTIIGRNYNGHNTLPCRVNPIPRPVPERLWYTEPLPLMLLGGLLPFAAIFIEMYFIFSSFFTYKEYYVYGFTLLALVMLLVVTGCVTVVAVYFILNAEEHRWHWLSFMIAGSTSLYVFLYSIYYYIARTKMYGLFQATFYFGYTAIGCVCMFIMLGTVGYFATHKFIRRIYTNVKID